MIISKEDEAQLESLPPYSSHTEASQTNDDVLAIGDVQARPVLVNPINSEKEEASASTSKASPIQLEEYPKHLRPTSAVHEHRKRGSITGEYVVDSSLFSMLQEIRPSRSAVHLETEDGNIRAKIWLVGRQVPGSPSSTTGSKRCPLFIVDAVNGFISLEIVTDCNVHSFTLKATCKNGGISVAVPTSFVGPLTMHTRNAWSRIYPVLSRDVTTFADVEGDKKCFIGDFCSSGFGECPWQGSSMDLTCENGRIKLFYENEFNRTESQRSPLAFLRQDAGYNQRAIMTPEHFQYSQM